MKRSSTIICIFLSMVICIPVFAVEKVYFVYTDPAGTPLTMTNDNGAIVWQAEYKPFGELQSEVVFVPNNKIFIGKELDAESGLYYFGARYMEARVGRFMSPDPAGPVDSKASYTNFDVLINPQKLNSYAYSANNPCRYVDPDGRAFLDLNDYFSQRQHFVGNYLSWAPTWLQEALYPRTPSHDLGIGPMPLAAPAVAARSATITLYRAVSKVEHQQLMETGRFAQGPNSLGGKFFAEKASDAAKWGERLLGAGNYRIISAELPTNSANQLMRWGRLDAIGPARYGELEQLTEAIIRGVP